MKNNGRQKAVYMALCVLAAIVVWVFVDNFGSNGGPNIESKWFRDFSRGAEFLQSLIQTGVNA